MNNRYRFNLIGALCAVLLLITGCVSTPDVYSDFDPRHDFTAHKTFTWVQNPPMLRAGDYPVSALAESRITEAIKAELMLKGYAYVEGQDEADFSVVYTMGARDKIDIVRRTSPYYSHRDDWGWGAYYFPFFVHFPFGNDPSHYEDLDEYTKGTIALDIFDAKTKQPIWHTKATKRLSKKELNAPQNNADAIARSLLKHYPAIACVVEQTRECQPFKASSEN